MKDSQKKFLDLFIDDGESLCVSHNKYGYHSISKQEFLSGNKFTLTPPEGSELKPVDITYDMVNMLAVNPIEGLRSDRDCTSFRGFLIEMDDGPLPEQMAYVEKMGMPYSCCVFSGSKSLHFGIVLDTPLPSLTAYRMVSNWILAIMTKADPKTKNPSRGIRFPGNLRRIMDKTVVPLEERKEQKLLQLKGRISQQELFNWLSKHKDKKPKVASKKRKKLSGEGSLKNLSRWAKTELKENIPCSKGRNTTWYALAYDFCLAGYSLDDTYSILEGYYVEEYDFARREWEYTLNRGYQTAMELA